MARRKKARRKSNGMKIPHPSVTGMASGLLIADTLNSGYRHTGGEQKGLAHHRKDTVVQNLTDGDLNGAFKRFSHNATELVTSSSGRRVLGLSVGVATVGAVARKLAGNPKLGGTRLFFRI